MGKVHNIPILKERRRELRTHGTKQEAILWNHLKDKARGFKFRRQHSIGNYVVDFCCPTRKLVVELDGAQHGEEDTAVYDRERTVYLNEHGYIVLRFWNNEIKENLSAVLLKIDSILLNPLLS